MPIMDVAVWLRSLGLGKYEAARSQREIDVSYRKSGRPLGTSRDVRRAQGLDNDLVHRSAEALPYVLSLVRGALS